MKRFAFKGSCVYAIVNVMNGKRYIGSTWNFQNRLQTHRFHLRRGTHANRYLQAAWKKYGENAFIFGVMQEVPTSQMIQMEQAAVDAARPHVYNIGTVVESPNLGRTHVSTMKGKKLSEETIQKMRTAAFKRWKERPFSDWPEEQKQRRVDTIQNNKHRMAASNRGQKRSEHTKELLRAAWIRRKQIYGMPHHSVEARLKAAASNRGQKRSEEVRARMRFAAALRRINSRPHAA